MTLVLKFFGFLLVLLTGNAILAVILEYVGFLTAFTVCLILLEIVIAVSIFMINNMFKPINNLHNALNIIDFDKDIIDLSKLDQMEVSGFKEIQFIIIKFKYLLDIITERINRVNSETYKSEHDGLTGCYNRVHLDNVKSMYEYSQSCCIIFIDVNNLKRMNDEFGHEAGDSLLKSAAYKLNFWSNYGDVYRMGGDEFMIVVLNKTSDYVNKLIDQWYPSVGQLNRDTDGFKCVLSYGVAFGTRGCNFDALMKKADDTMYKMKVALKKKFGEPMR